MTFAWLSITVTRLKQILLKIKEPILRITHTIIIWNRKSTMKDPWVVARTHKNIFSKNKLQVSYQFLVPWVVTLFNKSMIRGPRTSGKWLIRFIPIRWWQGQPPTHLRIQCRVVMAKESFSKMKTSEKNSTSRPNWITSLISRSRYKKNKRTKSNRRWQRCHSKNNGPNRAICPLKKLVQDSDFEFHYAFKKA